MNRLRRHAFILRVDTDEVDLNRNHISWVSPLGRALLKSAAGARVALEAPGGREYLTVLDVSYQPFLWNRSVNHPGPRHRRRNAIAHTHRPEKG